MIVNPTFPFAPETLIFIETVKLSIFNFQLST